MKKTTYLLLKSPALRAKIVLRDSLEIDLSVKFSASSGITTRG